MIITVIGLTNEYVTLFLIRSNFSACNIEKPGSSLGTRLAQYCIYIVEPPPWDHKKCPDERDVLILEVHISM